MIKTVILPLSWLTSLAAVYLVGSRLGGAEFGNSQDSGTKIDAVSGETAKANIRAVSNERSSTPGVVENLFGSESTDWESLVEKCATGSNPTARSLAFQQLLVAMTPENAFEMRERFSGLVGETESLEWIDFNYAFGAMCGREGFDIAAQGGTTEALKAVMSGWAAEDPSGALAMLDQLPDNCGSGASLAAALITGVATKNLQMATDMAQRLAARGKSHEWFISVDLAKQVIASQGVESAATWVESLSDEKVKKRAMEKIASAFGKKDPQAAAAWVEKFADQDYAAEAVEKVGDAMFRKDKAAALSWLESLPDGKAPAAGFRRVISNWQKANPKAAAEYINEMPDSPKRDSAIDGFARGASYDDPVTAITWAESISNPAIRQNVLKNAAYWYLRSRPEEALNWLPTSGLPEKMQQSLLGQR